MPNERNRNIIFVHLWNNYSGSPNVLRTVIDGLNKRGYKISVISSFNNKGFLTGVEGSIINIDYRFEKNIFIRMWQFIRFQILASERIWKTRENEIVYINTIQLFLPALTAKLIKRKIIYHIHEAYPKPAFFQRFLFYIVKKTSTQIICVSQYVKDKLDDSSKEKASVVYNSLSPDFLSRIIRKNKTDERKKVLMISSARGYKGIFHFCELARLMPDYGFTLACDISQDELNKVFAAYKDIENLNLYPTLENLHPLYSTHDLIVNLSNPKKIIETFGLTILEGMAYGLPAIVPPVGGIAELIDEGRDGYHIDVNEQNLLIMKIKFLIENAELYSEMSENAYSKSVLFNVNRQIENIEKLINV